MLIHIGKEIKAELRRQRRGVTWFAQQLYCDRTNVYNIFKREGIDTILLQRISAVLGRNFFALYCQETRSIARRLAMVRKMILQMCSIIYNRHA